VVVISLPSARARREEITKQLGDTTLMWSFFDAHTGLAADGLKYDPERAKCYFGRTLGRQELAVYSSHYAVMRDFLDRSPKDFALILEDDILFDLEFPLDDFCKVCNNLNIDYIRLFGKHYAEAERIGFFYDRNMIRYKTTPAGAQAYLISKRGAAILIDKLQDVIATPDRAMDRFWHTKLPVYGIFPYPFLERYSQTQIPMPHADNELTFLQRKFWFGFLCVEKARKIAANAVLHREDMKIRRSAGAFTQIMRSAPNPNKMIAA
jgi:GR25 family glycosyltransferase involved in LPS biosynthesis